MPVWAGAHGLAVMRGHKACHRVAGLTSSKERHLCFICFSRETSAADTWPSVLPCTGSLSGRKVKEGKGYGALRNTFRTGLKGRAAWQCGSEAWPSSTVLSLPCTWAGGTRRQGLECHTQQLGWAYRALRHQGAQNGCGQGHAVVMLCFGAILLAQCMKRKEEGLGAGERREGTLDIS